MKRIGALFLVLAAGAFAPAHAQEGDLPEERCIELCRTLRENVVAVTALRVREDAEEIVSRFSGIVYDDRGHVVTVADALEEGVRVYARFLDGTVVEAAVVGRDALTNVAVLRVRREGLEPVKPGPDAPPPVGATVYAVGNPFGLHHSVSTGIVSGTDRVLAGPDNRLAHGFLQTTAPINPGDAGGLLADSRGRFVGMISSTFGRAPSFGRIRRMIEEMIRRMNQDPEFKELVREVSRLFFSEAFGGGASQEDLEKKLEELGRRMSGELPVPEAEDRRGEGPGFGAHGINFALPARKVVEVADQLIRKGKVVRGRMGVRVLTLKGAPYHRTKYEIPPEVEGVLVAVLDAGGPAAKAGLQRFDVIVAYGGQPVTEPAAMMERVQAAAPGSRVALRVWRRGEGVKELEFVVEVVVEAAE